ncbi:hypothetical protein D3C85_1453310 [compost metagenome]
MSAEVELVLALHLATLPVVLMGHCQTQRITCTDVLVDRGLQPATSTAVPARVVAALACGLVEVAITFGGVAITCEAQISAGSKGLAVLQRVAHALEVLCVRIIDVGTGVSQVQGQCSEGPQVLGSPHIARPVVVTGDQAAIHG